MKNGQQKREWVGGLRLWQAACVLVITLLGLQAPAHSQETFKPFKLKTLAGASATLQDFPGKATLVSFFFPTCTYCNAALPSVQKLSERYKDQGLSVVWINVLPEENKKIAEWQTKSGFNVPVLIGASQASLQRDYKLIATPTHYLLDPSGKVLFRHMGYKSGDEALLEQKVTEALGIVPTP